MCTIHNSRIYRFVIATLLVFIITKSGYCQVIDFYKQYGGAVQLFTVCQSVDKGYIAAGSSGNSIGGDYLIIKTDSIGVEQWRQIGTLFNTLDSDNVAKGVAECTDKS